MRQRVGGGIGFVGRGEGWFASWLVEANML
jgi:hypothetical protein